MTAAVKPKPIDWFVKSCLADGGYAEHPLGSNITKFGRIFGWIKVAWCAIYAWCKYKAAGVPLPIKSASCVAIYDYAVANGWHIVSTKCVVGDSVIRGWQGISRTAKGFDAAETHYQIVVATEMRGGALWLGLWGGNQGAGYVGPAIEWVRAGDATILCGLAWSRLFSKTNVKPVKPVHDKTVDTKAGMPAAKSHPTALAAQSALHADALTGRLTKRTAPVAADGSRRKLRWLRAQITRVLKIGRKAK